ncbi:type VI secretion system protein TssA [Trinickia mobilis]|uniref:type VI secretion system protein TssA n=1 Tax=Trinickia mobilis TaxID=2816356 RepID=UPI001A8E7DC2|nr:type VI secretion system protein TssA [Trinickia mobilis]
MATLDAGAMLTEISPGSPCGDDVEYDPDFLELERVVLGKPDVQYGNTIVEAVPPDWKAAEALSLSLLSKSRDLRVATHLSRALLNRSGFSGFADALCLIEGMLTQRWDHVYPQLDPDDNDPTARVNALSSLIDQLGMLTNVRDTPIAASRTHGVVTMRDIEYATGAVSVPNGVEAPSLSSIDAVIADARDDAAVTLNALREGLRSTVGIETILTERVGAARSIDLSPLRRLLEQAADFLGERIGAEPSMESAGQEHVVAPEHDSPAAAVSPPGEIASRQDVIRMIDRICAYYERCEPSSPVPLLLMRARRLVDRSFMEILQDLAPEGLVQARQVSGIDKE